MVTTQLWGGRGWRALPKPRDFQRFARPAPSPVLRPDEALREIVLSELIESGFCNETSIICLIRSVDARFSVGYRGGCLPAP